MIKRYGPVVPLFYKYFNRVLKNTENGYIIIHNLLNGEVGEAQMEGFAQRTKYIDPESSSLKFSKKIGRFCVRLLYLFLILFVIVLLGLSVVLKLLNSDLIAEELVESVEFKGITAAEIEEGSSVDAKIAAMLGDELRERYNVRLSDEELESVMTQLDVTGFMQSYLDKYIRYVAKTGYLPIVDTSEYTDVIEQNRDLIEYVTGKKLNASYYKYQSIVVRKVNKYNRLAERFNEKQEEILVISQTLTKTATLTIVTAVLCVLLIAYGILRRKRGLRVYTTFRIYTVIFLLSGSLFFVARDMIIKRFVKAGSLTGTVISKLVSKVFGFVGYGYLGIGVVFAILWAGFMIPLFLKSRRAIRPA